MSDRPMSDRPTFDPHDAEVHAAGGVVWRHHPDGVRVLLVHRPHRSDWSIPKGRVDPGETLEQTALREIFEETGLQCAVGQPLGHICYFDHKQRSKTVWYWEMESASGETSHNDEVDEFAWLTIAEAMARSDYENDREVLRRFADRLAGWAS